jgi:hypothetical protein
MTVQIFEVEIWSDEVTEMEALDMWPSWKGNPAGLTWFLGF